MIPKIIHYFWSGSDELPPGVKRYMDTWRRHCPDCELRRWDATSLGAEPPRWFSQALQARKWAFAADYARAWALYHHGGIYFDTDVEMVRPVADLMELPYAFGRESSGGATETGTFMAEPGHPLFKALLDYYDSRPFLKADGTADMLPIPQVIDRVCADRGLRLVDVDSPAECRADAPAGVIYRLPKDYFSPIDLQTMRLSVTPRTRVIHHFAASWMPLRFRLKKRLQRAIGPTLTMAVIKLKRKFLKAEPEQI